VRHVRGPYVQVVHSENGCFQVIQSGGFSSEKNYWGTKKMFLNKNKNIFKFNSALKLHLKLLNFHNQKKIQKKIRCQIHAGGKSPTV
jgi:hypothetical protein